MQYRSRIPIIAAGLFQGRPERSLLSADALRPYSLLHLADRGRLVVDVIAHRPVVLLLPPVDVRGIPSSPLIERVRREAPEVVVALVVTDQSLLGVEVIRASRVGAVIVRASQASDLRQSLAPYLGGPILSATELGELDFLLRTHLPSASPLELEIVRAAVRITGRREAATRLARHFAVSRRTLVRRARAQHTVAPHQFLIWGRLLQASSIAQRGTSSHTAVVRAAGFSSPTAYRSALRRLIGEEHAASLLGHDAGAITPALSVIRAIARVLLKGHGDHELHEEARDSTGT